MAWSCALFVGLLLLGAWVVVPASAGWLTSLGATASLAKWIGWGLYLGLWVWLGGVVYLAIAGVMSSFLWDALAEAVEGTRGPLSPFVPVSAADRLADTAGRAAFSAAIALLALVAGWWCVPIAWLLAGWLGLYDYTASAYLRRGVVFRAQRRRALRCRGAGGFAAVSGLLGILPLVNVLMLPAMVAGGTLLVCENEPK